MTENETPAHPDSTIYLEPDHVLANYVRVFNQHPETKMSLTVFAAGYAFSGLLVAGSTYFEASADLAEEKVSGELAQIIAVPFRELASQYRAMTEDDHANMTTTYVHMVDVNVFGGSRLLGQMPVWRGRLSEISGWSLLQMTPT